MDWLIKPRRLEFRGRGSFREINQLCNDDEVAKQFVPISDITQVALSPESGTTPGGRLRFNTQAFRQICSVVGGNLSGTLQTAWKQSAERDEVKRRLLLKAYNNLVKAQMETLLKYKLVVDHMSHEIVGIVGAKYQVVTNLELLQPCAVVVKSGQYIPVYARMDNRDMFVLMLRPDTAAEGLDGRWTQGVSIFNSETTNLAVFLPQTFSDNRTRSYSFEEESHTNKLIHRKKKGFHQQLDAVVQAALQHTVLTPEIVQDAAWRLSPIFPGQSRAVAVAKIKSQLVREGFGLAVVERVIFLIGEDQTSEIITRRMVYSVLLQVADEAIQVSRALRLFANKKFIRFSRGSNV